MRRYEVEVPTYSVNRGEYAVYGPLVIKLNDVGGFPRALRPGEAFTGVEDDLGVLLHGEPDDSTAIEVISSTGGDVYYPTTQFDTVDEVINNANASETPRLLFDDFYIDLREEVTPTSLENLYSGQVKFPEDSIVATIDGNKEISIQREELDDALRNNEAEFLIPFILLDRAYHGI